MDKDENVPLSGLKVYLKLYPVHSHGVKVISLHMSQNFATELRLI